VNVLHVDEPVHILKVGHEIEDCVQNSDCVSLEDYMRSEVATLSKNLITFFAMISNSLSDAPFTRSIPNEFGLSVDKVDLVMRDFVGF
jgi:hypothetical protein